MHELSIVMEVVRQVQEIAAANSVSKVAKIVLQIGEASPIVPRFVEECYPVAVDGTTLEATELELEILPAMGRCRACEKIYRVSETEGLCPACQSPDFELLGGRDMILKQIVVEEESGD